MILLSEKKNKENFVSVCALLVNHELLSLLKFPYLVQKQQCQSRIQDGYREGIAIPF